MDSTSTPIGGRPSRAKDGDFALLGRLLRDYLGQRWGALALATFCMMATASMQGALAWVIDPAIKTIFIDGDRTMAFLIPLAVAGIMVVRALMNFGEQALTNSIGERIVASLQRDMFRTQIGLDLGTLNAEHSGEMVSRFLNDTTLLRAAINRGVTGLGRELLSLLALTAVMIYQDWQLAAISVLLLPVVAWVTQRLSRSLRKSSTRGMEEAGVLTRALTEALAGRRIIKAYNLETRVTKAAEARISGRLKHLLRAVRSRAAAVPSTDVIGGVAAALTMAYAGYQHFNGTLEINQFGSFVAAMLLAQQPVRNLSQLWTISSEGVAAAKRIFAVIDTRPAIVDAPDAGPLRIAPPPASAHIRFDGVHFAYSGAEPALDDVGFEIAPGRKAALVGPSGAGKSTVFNLLLRFYDPDDGTVLIDDQDIRGVTLASLRANIALVTQEPFLFDETIRDNIGYGRPGAGLDAIVAAAKSAAAHEFISELPKGYDTRVGEGGLRLSGGQRQRIAIARAMLRDAPILLLDEATSALDTENERVVQDALRRLMKGRTTIVIAHRLSTVVDADRLYVLDKGRVVETGTHGELMARGGLYARLYRHELREDDAAPATHLG
jgi:ATP-binding cassette, subfamily B, bacterial MsbA